MAEPVLGKPDLARVQRLFVLAARRRPWPARCRRWSGKASAYSSLVTIRARPADPHPAFDVFTGSLFDGHLHKTYGGNIGHGRYMARRVGTEDVATADLPETGFVTKVLSTLIIPGGMTHVWVQNTRP